MRAKPEYRDRDETEVAVLDALADRQEEGMTVFELRSRVDVDIDTLEDALAELKTDGLIEATDDGRRTLIFPDDSAVGPVASDDDEDGNVFDQLRDRLPF
jgi:predicted transcriptional regulator